MSQGNAYSFGSDGAVCGLRGRLPNDGARRDGDVCSVACAVWVHTSVPERTSRAVWVFRRKGLPYDDRERKFFGGVC